MRVFHHHISKKSPIDLRLTRLRCWPIRAD